MPRRFAVPTAVTLAIAASLWLLPTAAHADTFDTAVSCISPSACAPSSTTPAGNGNDVSVTEGGGGPVQIFVVVPLTNAVTIDSVVATFSDGTTQTLPIQGSYSFDTSPTFVTRLDVNWDAAGQGVLPTTTSTSSTSTSTSSTSTTTTTVATTTTTVPPAPLPRGPGNGPLPIRTDLSAISAPGATAVRGNERVDAVVQGSDHNAYWTSAGDGGWSAPVNLGTPPPGFASRPAIVSWAPGRLDVFVEGQDNKLWQTFSIDGGATWSGWLQPFTEGVLASAPKATTRGPGLLDLYVTGTDGQVYQRFWNGSTWNGGWISIGAPSAGIIGSPTAVSMNGVREDVFAEGGDAKLWERTWDGSQWTGWFQTVGSSGTLASVPDATAWDANTMLVVTLGSDGHLYALAYGGVWGGWTRLGGAGDIYTSAPAATSRGVNRFDIFADGTDSLVYQTWQ